MGLVDDEGKGADGPGNEDHREEVQDDLVWMLTLRKEVRNHGFKTCCIFTRSSFSAPLVRSFTTLRY